MTAKSQKPVTIASVDHIDENLLLIGFTDGTSAALTIEELLVLRPDRPQLDEPSDSA